MNPKEKRFAVMLVLELCLFAILAWYGTSMNGFDTNVSMISDRDSIVISANKYCSIRLQVTLSNDDNEEEIILKNVDLNGTKTFDIDEFKTSTFRGAAYISSCSWEFQQDPIDKAILYLIEFIMIGIALYLGVSLGDICPITLR